MKKVLPLFLALAMSLSLAAVPWDFQRSYVVGSV